MNIVIREFRANLKSLIIWSLIIVLFSMVGFSKFSAFYGNPDLLAILDSMPPAMINALSMNAFNLTTVTGFFGIMVIYFSLILTISAAMWGSDIISKEERDKTVEFSLTLPVARSKLVTSKIIAVVVNCILLLLVTWGVTIVGAQKYNPDSEFAGFVTMTMLSFFLLQMIFMGLGIFLGCALKQHKRAGAIAVSVLLVSYFASIIYGLNNDLKFLKYLSPFEYFKPVKILQESSLEITYVLLSLAIVAVFLVGGYAFYSKRDLYI
jgi:ABC-2 type transport system permease protein